jgi:hypothetical protein
LCGFVIENGVEKSVIADVLHEDSHSVRDRFVTAIAIVGQDFETYIVNLEADLVVRVEMTAQSHA